MNPFLPFPHTGTDYAGPDPLVRSERLGGGVDVPPGPSDPATDPEFEVVARDLSAAIRSSHWDGEEARYRYLNRRAAPDAPSVSWREREYMEAVLERVCISRHEIAEVYRVTPAPGLTASERQLWNRAVRGWRRDPNAYQTDAEPALPPKQGHAQDQLRSVQVRVLRTTRELRRMVAEYLGEEAAEAIPVSIARPIEAAGPVTPGAVRLLASKVSARQAGTAVLQYVRELFSVLPGWSCEDAVLARPFDDSRDPPRLANLMQGRLGEQAMYHHGGPPGVRAVVLRSSKLSAGFTRAHFAAVSEAVVVDPSIQAHKPVRLAVGEVICGGLDYHLDTHESWTIRLHRPHYAMDALVVRAPDGDTFAIYRTRSVYPPRESKALPPEMQDDPNFWHWAYKHGLGKLGDGVLAGLNIHEVRYALRSSSSSLRNTGECQLCANVQKLRGKDEPATRIMVDHGYHYPWSEGFRGGKLGEREARCEGVDHLPYEKSCKLLVALRPGFQKRAEEALARLRRMEEIIEKRESILVPRCWVTRVPADRGIAEVSADDPRWTGWAHAALRDLRFRELSAREYLRWVEHRIATWTLRPLYDEIPKASKA